MDDEDANKFSLMDGGKLNDTIIRLKKFNEWRRGNNPETFDKLDISPKQIGIDIDYAIKLMNNVLYRINSGEPT